MKLLWALLAVLLAIMAIFAGTGKAEAEPYGFGRGGFGRGGFGGRYGGYGGFGGRGYGGFGRGFYG
jgi:hypothetical protein